MILIKNKLIYINRDLYKHLQYNNYQYDLYYNDCINIKYKNAIVVIYKLNEAKYFNYIFTKILIN